MANARKKKQKTFTQKEVDRIVRERLSRDREKRVK